MSSASTGNPGLSPLFAGVDIGSTTSKAVLIDEAGAVVAYSIVDTKHDRNQSGEEVLAMALEAAGRDEAGLAMVARFRAALVATGRTGGSLRRVRRPPSAFSALHSGVRRLR